VRVVSLNVNGLRAAERKGVRALLAELDADDEGRDALVVGDLNIAHAEIDLRNWRANRRTSGFLPEERAWLSEALALGYVDVVRELAGPETAAYSWWSQRAGARERDVGWRIDLQLATPGLASRATGYAIPRTPVVSDHAPVVVDYRDGGVVGVALDGPGGAP
jgi:exodeoxyribonuclease III